MLPILYSFRRCPYAMRARLALAVSGTQCELREVVLRDKPAELLQASPKGTVPVLVLADGRILEQSLDIMLWALSRHDPQGWLAPKMGELEQMLALIGECDSAFKHDLDRYKYPDRYEGVDAMSHRESAWQWLKMLDDRLAYSAYLFGERPALADAAIMPFVRQFAQVDRAWFDAQPWPALLGWLGHWLESDLFQAIMAKHAPWAGGPGASFP